MPRERATLQAIEWGPEHDRNVHVYMKPTPIAFSDLPRKGRRFGFTLFPERCACGRESCKEHVSFGSTTKVTRTTRRDGSTIHFYSRNTLYELKLEEPIDDD